MLISSCTIDKDSVHLKSNASLRTHHRALMASMSKLTLSAQTCNSSFDNEEATINKIISESNDLLLLVRNYIGTCTDLNLPLVDADPKWVRDDDAKRRPSNSSQRYSLQINLAENLETMGTCIQDSADTIVKCIKAPTKNKTSLAALLFTHFRNLSNQTGLFLGYLDDTDFTCVQGESEMTELMLGKQYLSDGLGLLFFKMQALTNEDTTEFDKCLKETEMAAGRLFDPIELICASVLRLANKNRSRSNSTASVFHTDLVTKPAAMIKDDSIITEEDEEEDDDLFSEAATSTVLSEDLDDRKPSIDRHQSELISSTSKVPPPMVRSHTSPPTKQTSSNKLKKFFGDDKPIPVVAVKASKPAEEEKPAFLQYDYGPNDIVFNMEGNVKGGTLPALVERLTMHDYLDMNFINTFLLTYRSFCSSSDLLDLLEARYNLQCPPDLTQEEATMWEEKKLKLVRLRVFNVLKNWLELYYNEDDSGLLDRLLEFTHTNIKKTLKFSNGQLESLIQKRRNALDNGGGLKKMILTLPDPPEPILPRNRKRYKLLDIDTLEMARQLTIMDFKLYSAIRPIECLDKAWSSQEDDQAADNIRASIEYCNQVTSWVSDAILSQNDIKKRSVLIKYWVQVAEVIISMIYRSKITPLMLIFCN